MKLCIDFRWFVKPKKPFTIPLCLHPKIANPSPVDGLPEHAFPRVEREFCGKCGRRGKHWEPKETPDTE
jgi:hypothetical protein